MSAEDRRITDLYIRMTAQTHDNGVVKDPGMQDPPIVGGIKQFLAQLGDVIVSSTIPGVDKDFLMRFESQVVKTQNRCPIYASSINSQSSKFAIPLGITGAQFDIFFRQLRSNTIIIPLRLSVVRINTISTAEYYDPNRLRAIGIIGYFCKPQLEGVERGTNVTIDWSPVLPLVHSALVNNPKIAAVVADQPSPRTKQNKK